MSSLSFQEFRIKTLVNMPDPDAVINEMALMIEEPVIGDLEVIAKKKRDDKIRLPGDNSKVRVDVTSANAVLDVYKKLNSRNKTKMLQMLQNKRGFEKMVKFSIKQTSF